MRINYTCEGNRDKKKKDKRKTTRQVKVNERKCGNAHSNCELAVGSCLHFYFFMYL